jgi:hypothetical protein
VVPVVGILGRRLAGAGLGREYVWVTSLGVLNANLVIPAGTADLGTADNIEEGSSEEYFERGVFDDLDLQVNGDWTELDRVILDEA